MNVEMCGHVADLIVMAHAFAELRNGVVARQHENGFKYGDNISLKPFTDSHTTVAMVLNGSNRERTTNIPPCNTCCHHIKVSSYACARAANAIYDVYLEFQPEF